MVRVYMVKIAVISCVTGLMLFDGIAKADNVGPAGEYGCLQHDYWVTLEKELGLSDAQKARVRAIFEGNRDIVKPIIANLRAEKRYLHGLMRANTVDEAAIRAETFSVAGIQADLNVNRAKVMLKFRAILSSAQLEILKTLLQKRDADGRTGQCPQ